MATEASLAWCAHCGLPLKGFRDPSRDLFCCHACSLAAAIVGRGRDGEKNWNLLRLGVGAILSMNVMMVSLLLYAGSVDAETVPLFRWIMLGLSAPALAILLPPFFSPPSRAAARGSITMEALITAGSFAAFSVSAADTLRGRGPVYYDTATMLPVLVTLGRLLEGAAKSGAAELLKSMESLLPETALKVVEGGTVEVPVAALVPGDSVRLRLGEKVPVDGVVVEGMTTVEEASFTGEYLPRPCRPGDFVVAGTINGAGSAVVEASHTGDQLLLHRMIDLVQQAWRNPSEAELIAERAAASFIPLVLLTAAGSALYWASQGDPGRGWLSALSVAVVACPCTMGIATPLATSLAIARAAKEGIVVRGGKVMERVGATDFVYFDKTGTLTLGLPVLTGTDLLHPGATEEGVLGMVAAVEKAANHPLGRAVIATAKARRIEEGEVADVTIRPGDGVEGTVTWQERRFRVAVGASLFPERAEPEAGVTTVQVTVDGRPTGKLSFRDAPRKGAAEAVAELRALGIRCGLLSGDRMEAAREVADRVGIDVVEAPRSPAHKLAAVRSGGTRVTMVGDGVNDAPALAAAPVGIAIGAGTELARQAGNVVIVSNRLMLVPWLVSLSRMTRRIVRGNFAWSFGYNGIALAAAAAGLLHPLLAALAMVFSSITVLGNSLRISAFPAPLSKPEEPVEGSI